MCRLYALPAALKGEAVNLKTMMEMWDVESTLSMVFFTLFVLFSLIQIAPIKINPWDAILGWIGDKLNGGIQKEFRAFWVDFHRQAILNFCRECRQDVQHSKEEDTIDSNPWKLQVWHRDEDTRKGQLKNLSDNRPLQERLAHALSMFEVSFTARQRNGTL